MKKKDLLLSVIPLFLKKGYKVLTMDEIANNLSISKKTIYKYFATKKELVVHVNDEIVEYFNRLMREEEGESANAVAFMFNLRVTSEKVMDIEMQKQFIEQAYLINEKIGKKTAQVIHKVLYNMAHYSLKKTEKEGCLDPTIDIHTIATVFANNYIGLLTNDEYESEDEFKHVMRSWYYLHIKSLLNEDGVSLIDKLIRENPHYLK